MAEDDLTPTDGLCNVFLELDAMQKHMDGPGADFRFRFTHRRGGQEYTISTITVEAYAENDGFPGMMVRAYDELIRILRQGLYISGKMRQHYRKEAETHYPRET